MVVFKPANNLGANIAALKIDKVTDGTRMCHEQMYGEMEGSSYENTSTENVPGAATILISAGGTK